MPQAVAVLVIDVLVATFGTTAAVFILDVGVKLAGLALLGALSRKLTKIPDLSQTAKANTVTVRGTLEHQRIIYGEALFSGPLWYMNSAGSHNQSLYHAVVVAGHEIEDITDVWFDDEVIPEASIDWAGDGSVDSGWLAGDTVLQTTTYLDKFLGTASQAASPDLVAAFTEITSQHQGRSIAYFLARTDYFDGQTQVWSGGVPRNYKALVKGKKVYNPSSDSTQAWGTGPHRLVTSSTWEWSDDPALCWADHMIDNRLGFGEAAARIDYAYVASVSAINRAIVYTPVGTDYRFRCNGGLSTGNTYEANLASILAAGNMTMALVQGSWKLRGWEHETPALAFGDDELRADIAINLSTEEQVRYNTVRGVFVDKDRRYQPQQFPAFTSSEYVARDNSETLFSDIQLPLVTDVYQAQRLAAGILEQSDLQRNVIYPSNFKTLPVEIGGTVKLSNTKMGWVDETFRVTNYKLSDMKGIDLVLQEDSAAAYTDVGTAEYTVSSAGTYITADPGVPAPSSMWVLSRRDGNLIQWNSPPARLYETVKLYAAVTSDAFANASEIADIKGTAFLHDYGRPRRYWYWARAVNFAGELSDVIPTSGASNVFGFPGLIGGIPDATFDLSTDIADFFDVLANSAWIDATGGESGEHALGMAKIGNSNAGAALATNQYFPIKGTTLRVSTRYRVNSNYGTWPNSLALAFGVRTAYPTPVASTFDKFQQTMPSSYTSLGGYDEMILTNSVTVDGSWYTISKDFDLATAIDSGATVMRPVMRWIASDSVSIDTSINARHNNFVFYWV